MPQKHEIILDKIKSASNRAKNAQGDKVLSIALGKIKHFDYGRIFMAYLTPQEFKKLVDGKFIRPDDDHVRDYNTWIYFSINEKALDHYINQ